MSEDALPADRPVLLLPGFGNSGPEHWQSHWERCRAGCRRVEQADWEHPVCRDWMPALESAVRAAGPRALIAAHSLGCLLLVHWLARTCLEIAGALLVAVPDPGGPHFPVQARGFEPVPVGRIACPSIIVASADDLYGSLEFARRCADSWGSRVVSVGAAGHINAASGLGAWRAGQVLLSELSCA